MTNWSISDIDVRGVVSGSPTWRVGSEETISFLLDGTDTAAYRALKRHIEWAGTGSVERSIDGVPLLTERLPDRAAIESNVVLVEPADDVYETDGYWCLIVDGTDESTNIGEGTGAWNVSLTMVVLADADQYATRGELERDLAVLQTALDPPFVVQDALDYWWSINPTDSDGEVTDQIRKERADVFGGTLTTRQGVVNNRVIDLDGVDSYLVSQNILAENVEKFSAVGWVDNISPDSFDGWIMFTPSDTPSDVADGFAFGFRTAVDEGFDAVSETPTDTTITALTRDFAPSSLSEAFWSVTVDTTPGTGDVELRFYDETGLIDVFSSGVIDTADPIDARIQVGIQDGDSLNADFDALGVRFGELLSVEEIEAIRDATAEGRLDPI